MPKRADIACVILAAGRGRRMGPARVPKVCLPVLGRPAIVRACETYQAAGLRRILVVVGRGAGRVVRTVGRACPEATFVYQARQRGTGDAAAAAVEAIARQGRRPPPVMVTMGDKVTFPHVVDALISRFLRSRADLVMAALPKDAATSAGRIVTAPDGRLLGIVEQADIDLARRTGRRLVVGGRAFSAEGIERRSAMVNPSLYLFRFEPLRRALRRLRADNAQGELYLTDVVGEMAAAGKVEILPLDDPGELMAFNTPQELRAVEQNLRRRSGPGRVRLARRTGPGRRTCLPAGRWLELMDADGAGWNRLLAEIYGPSEPLLSHRKRAIRRLVATFARLYGPDRPTIICRAPGRVNLMGRHVDHRGGYVNVMAFGREVLLAAAPRDDGQVRLRHVRPGRFPARSFAAAELLAEARGQDWRSFVDGPAVRRLLASRPGDWSHYARAAVLRLACEARGRRPVGMDCLVAGDIPMGAGLSSSSAMVVAFALATAELNGLKIDPGDFVDLCGEGEWFVGSRGGSADHAAISTARLGRIGRMGFLPFRRAGSVPLGEELSVVIAPSGRRAEKSAGARDVYNQRVACYDLAQMLLGRRWPPARGAACLRDLLPRRLGVPPAELYRGLMSLPVRPRRAQLLRLLAPADRPAAERIFSTHRGAGGYDLRGVVLFGLGEIARAERFAELLRRRDYAAVSRLIRTSHDGDRIVRWTGPAGRPRRFIFRTDDAALRRLADAGTDPAEQPGRYACSTDEIDLLVDLADACPGVIGAQLAGAGLGGCASILVRTSAVAELMRRLRRDFYEPRGLAFGAFVCRPIAGASVLKAPRE
ncbi:MAG: NTP transferase domain-containing protein [Planctomycetes bacterium]|nr:NTP transferase domain-containing protein [Planctomycetota bacterium]